MRAYLFLLLLIFFPSLQANDDPVQCVEPRFREAIFGLYGGPVTYSTDMPLSFPDIAVPAEFELVGSTSRRGHTSVAFYSELDTSASGEALSSSMSSDDWIELPKHQYEMRGGFVTKVRFDPAMPQAFCKDPIGTTQFSYRDASMGGSFIVVSKYGGDTTSCDEALRQRRDGHNHRDRKMPTLELPPDVQHQGGGGSCGGGDLRSTSNEFSTKMSVPEVGSHFATQLLNQHWIKEGEWVGQGSVGHTWLSEDESLVLQIIVTQKSNGQLLAMMTQAFRGN